MSEPGEPTLDPRVGLCSICVHGRRVVSGRGSVFWRCGLSDTDPRFRKYPPLPVTRCPGFEPTVRREPAG